jgi:hypothetical protein
MVTCAVLESFAGVGELVRGILRVGRVAWRANGGSNGEKGYDAIINGGFEGGSTNMEESSRHTTVGACRYHHWWASSKVEANDYIIKSVSRVLMLM